ncbi:MAG: GmrSD restriction endonuclease domain-containing protein [Streptosporangiaceae bacterium]
MQQRLTSLFQTLRSGKPVETSDGRGNDITRWYYIDISRALNDLIDREDAIVSVPADRKVLDSRRKIVQDLSTQQAECAAGMFPLRLALDSSSVTAWLRDFVSSNDAGWDIWDKFERKVLENVKNYQLPVIRLAKETPKEAVCTVFEKVNTGGVPLNVFELLTATYAGDPDYIKSHEEDFHLPEQWKTAYDDIASHSVFQDLKDTDFLQAITLVSTHFRRRGRTDTDPFTQPAASCKRGDILDLPLDEYLKWSSQIVSALYWAAEFLKRQGVFGPADLPYRSQIVALAAIRAVLGPEADSRDAEAQITKWYWCGVLGEQYGGSPDSRLPRDLEQVVAWVRGGREPASVTEANFPPARLDTMSSRNSAAYKGVLALLMREGATDWTYAKEPINATIYADQQIDVALIFPKAWCDKNGIRKERRDSIVNKTPLTNRTRRIMGNQSPDIYLQQIEAEAGLPGNWLDDIIQTHRVNPKYLRGGRVVGNGPQNSDFDGFYRARSAALKELIDDAMGKQGAGVERQEDE